MKHNLTGWRKGTDYGMEARIAELIALGIILLSAFEGAVRGLVMKIYSMVRFVLVLVLSIILVPLILKMIPSTVAIKEGIAFAAAFVLSGIILSVVAGLLKIIDHIPVVSTLNKIGGALIGGAMGVIFVWVLLLVIGAFQTEPWCQTAAGYVRQSPVLMAVQSYNPLPVILEKFDFPVLR